VSAQAAAPPFSDLEQQADAARLGMWIFLATEVLFFGPLFMGYIYGRMHFGDAFAAASRHTDVVLGTINTAVLLTSSFTMALAVEARRGNASRLARRLLFATALLGVVFLAIKGFEYRSEWHEHLVPGPGFEFGPAQFHGAEIFFYLYFVMTGLHALHLTIGILVTIALAVMLTHDAKKASRDRVEVAGLYWHFVDVAWIFLYPVLYLVGRVT
jgi:cytochrome c oxidase subunit 3